MEWGREGTKGEKRQTDSYMTAGEREEEKKEEGEDRGRGRGTEGDKEEHGEKEDRGRGCSNAYGRGQRERMLQCLWRERGQRERMLQCLWAREGKQKRSMRRKVVNSKRGYKKEQT
jgi:hypothetical protein